MTFLNRLSQCDTIKWFSFSKQEFKNVIAKCSFFFTFSLDHISQRHLKLLIANNECLEKIVYIANTCITLSYGLSNSKQLYWQSYLNLTKNCTILVMNIEWDYSYYQPQSNNEWLVDEMIAMREETLMVQNENITMQ